MIYHIYFRVGAYVRYWFLHSIQDFLDQFWFFWDISIEFIQNISNLGILWFCVLQVFFVFVVFLAVSCSQLSAMASCPLVLLAAYLYLLIRYRQMYGHRDFIFWAEMSSSLTLPAKIVDLSDTVIFDLETVREDAIFSFINIDNNNKNKSIISQSWKRYE